MTQPSRREAGVNLVQALIFGGGAWWLAERWPEMAAFVGLAAAAQLAGGGALAATRDGRYARWADIASLALVALLLGLHLQVSAFIITTFASEGAKTGWQALGSALLILPYGAFLPSWQLVRLRPGRIEPGLTAALVLAAALLPPAAALATGGADRELPAVDGAPAAAWLYAAWTGGDAGAPPDASGPVYLVAAAFSGPEIIHRDHAEAASLAEALRALGAPGQPPTAVTLEVVRAEGPLASLPGSSPAILLGDGGRGVAGPKRVLGAAELMRNPSTRTRAVLPMVYAPTAHLKGVRADEGGRWLETDGWVASAAGVAALHRGWAAPAPFTPESLVEAALAGGRQLLQNMKPSGRFTYVVEGPSGERKGGYNFPRHAGTTWFLARLASRTGDPEIRRGAASALDYLRDNTQVIGDRAFILDPGRGDGKAWVGTTALALLAFVEAGVDPALQEQYTRFIASSVTPDGVVRGNFSLEREIEGKDSLIVDGRWLPQPEITYAQGQGLLALAVAERAGVPGASEALDRAAAYVDDHYWPMPAARLAILDEHWMCLAAQAVGRVRDVDAGEAVCRAYVASLETPLAGAMREPAAAAAAGLGEAVISLAEIERRRGEEGPIREAALQYGRWLLEQQYRPADAGFLGQADNLIGGWRDRAWGPFDVRIDGVQHIACALLGVEQLLRGEELPGAMP